MRSQTCKRKDLFVRSVTFTVDEMFAPCSESVQRHRQTFPKYLFVTYAKLHILCSHFSRWILSLQFVFSHVDPEPNLNCAWNNLYNRPGLILNTFSIHLKPMKSPSAFSASSFWNQSIEIFPFCHKCSENPGVKKKTRKYQVKNKYKKCYNWLESFETIKASISIH